MSHFDLLHLLELLMTPQERVFVHGLSEDPEDDLTRNAYADWLLDQGRPMHAKNVRDGHTPLGKPKRGSRFDHNWYPTPGIVPPSGAYPLPYLSGSIGIHHLASGAVSSGSISITSGPWSNE